MVGPRCILVPLMLLVCREVFGIYYLVGSWTEDYTQRRNVEHFLEARGKLLVKLKSVNFVPEFTFDWFTGVSPSLIFLYKSLMDPNAVNTNHLQMKMKIAWERGNVWTFSGQSKTSFSLNKGETSARHLMPNN